MINPEHNNQIKKDLLRMPVIQSVWEEVKDESPGTFPLLEKLEIEDFKIDPISWP